MTELSLTLEIEQVVELVLVSRRTIERLVAKKLFPAPIKLGARSLWRRADIELFIECGSIHAYRRARRGD